MTIITQRTRVILFAILVAPTLLGLAATSAGKAKAVAGASKGTESTKSAGPRKINLPTAHAGQKYSVHVYLPSQFPAGWIQYALDPAPHWLTFNSTTSTLSGTPDETASVTYSGVELVLKSTADASAAPEVFDFTLPVTTGADEAFPSGDGHQTAPARKAATGKGTVASSESTASGSPLPVPSVIVSPDVSTTSTALAGKVDPTTLPDPLAVASGSPAGTPPPNYPQLGVEIVDPVSHLTWLSASGGGKNSGSPVQSDGTFSIPLASPPPDGAQLILFAMAPSGYTFGPARIRNPQLDAMGERQAAPPILVKQALIPLPRLSLPGILTVGQSAISGVVDPASMPPFPVAASADAKTGTASPGNLASLAVEITDPLTKSVSRVPMLVPGAPGSVNTQVPIGTDGHFSMSLKTPLTSGESIRIIAIPPQGYAFSVADRSACDTGRPPYLSNEPSLVGNRECVVLPEPDDPLMVFSTLALTQPMITSSLGLNGTTISGTATPSTTGANGTTVLIGVQRMPLGDPCRHTAFNPILTSDQIGATLLPSEPEFGCRLELADLAIAASGSTPAGTAKTVQTQANGTFSFTLATPLQEEEKLRIVEIFPPGTMFPDPAATANLVYSTPVKVPAVADWGRIHADFAAGMLTTNNSLLGSSDTGTFTQAHQFLDLTVEKSWTLPGCYLEDGGECVRKLRRADPAEPGEPNYRMDPDQNWWFRHHPGFSSYFEGRLTAIPVATAGSSSGNSGSNASGGGSESGTGSLFSPLQSNLLTTAQTARFGVGAYAPALLQRWNWHGTPNALFVAPLAKIGFDSVTGANTVNVPSTTPGATSSGTVTLESLYNFWGFGARVGHLKLSRSESKSPETESYIDIIVGPYSNLQSFVCKKTPADKMLVTTTTTDQNGKATTSTAVQYVAADGFPAVSGLSGSSCGKDYPDYYTGQPAASLRYTIPDTATNGNTTITYSDEKVFSFQPLDGRKRLYRLDFEGLLKIPATPLYVGFNANIGQKTLGALRLDHGYVAPDSLEIFFGTKFDIGELFAKIGIKPF